MQTWPLSAKNAILFSNALPISTTYPVEQSHKLRKDFFYFIYFFVRSKYLMSKNVLSNPKYIFFFCKKNVQLHFIYESTSLFWLRSRYILVFCVVYNLTAIYSRGIRNLFENWSKYNLVNLNVSKQSVWKFPRQNIYSIKRK